MLAKLAASRKVQEGKEAGEIQERIQKKEGRNAKNFFLGNPSIQIRTSAQAPLTAEEERTRTAKRNEGGGRGGGGGGAWP